MVSETKTNRYNVNIKCLSLGGVCLELYALGSVKGRYVVTFCPVAFGAIAPTPRDSVRPRARRAREFAIRRLQS